ncbi:MAG: hypothetical protein IT342_07980 [Candidatus Melainabacteria bacterium]|nr:hypothetical protein [Candidatus Melainabacteria bacterium]
MTNHINRSTLAVLILSLSFGVSPALAGDTDHVISSCEARTENAITATKIPWETSLEKAKAKSAASGKPILWVHMLGNIDGYT